MKQNSTAAKRSPGRKVPVPTVWMVSAFTLALAGFGCSAPTAEPGADGPEGVGTGASSSSGGRTGVGGRGPGAGGSVSGAGGSVSGAGGVTEPVEVGDLKIEGKPSYFRVVRLTHDQWESSVRDLLELPAVPGLSGGFFPDSLSGSTFSNNERGLYMTDTLRLDYERAAQVVADNVTKDAAAMSRLGNAGNPDAFIAALGKRAHKRALSGAEATRYRELWNLGAGYFESGDAFKDGARIFLEALLQSTYFVNRIELSTDGERLSGPELATKLSYLLRNTLPSDDLMTAAESGNLDTDDGLSSIVTQMLEEPPAEARADQFFTELYGLDRYSKILKDKAAFPTFNDSLVSALQEADTLFFRRIFFEGLGLREIYLSKVAYVNSAIAPIYGLTSTGATFREVELGDDRPGYLTRAGFLALNGTLVNPSPIHRGVDINRRMLCEHMETPPGLAIPPLPTPKAGQTNREAITEMTEVGICAECHSNIINPPGFALEGFDAIGQSRTTDNGKPIDTTGTFGALSGAPFDGPSEMIATLAESRKAHGCFSARMIEFALTRDLGLGEVGLISDLQVRSQEGDASAKDLLLSILKSPEFTNAKTGTQ